MGAAYKRLLGDAFPAADPESVLQVLSKCNVPGGTTQKLIAQATRIPQPTVAKLLIRMKVQGLVEVSERDKATRAKAVNVTLEGQTVLSDFERACQIAVKHCRRLPVQGHSKSSGSK